MTAFHRRTILAGGAGLLTIALVRPGCAAIVRPTREATVEAIRRFTGGAPIRAGRIHLDMPPLVENGNTVPLSITVESPMSATDFVRRIAVFNDKNPQPHVVTLHLGPRPAAPRSIHGYGSPIPRPSPPSRRCRTAPSGPRPPMRS